MNISACDICSQLSFFAKGKKPNPTQLEFYNPSPKIYISKKNFFSKMVISFKVAESGRKFRFFSLKKDDCDICSKKTHINVQLHFHVRSSGYTDYNLFNFCQILVCPYKINLKD